MAERIGSGIEASQSSWQIIPAPNGHGECIAKTTDGITDVIILPGVPAAPGPQPVEELMQWQHVRRKKVP